VPWNRNPISPKTISARPISSRVRRFKRRDLERVLAIERACFGKDAWPSELFIAYFRASPELFLVAMHGRRIAGYSITRVDWRGAELESIAVDPKYHGRGVAQALLQATVSRLRTGTLRLMVGTDNEPALRFYQRFGFIRMRKVARYYGPGRDAWRMRLELRPKQQTDE
jgi:[ribosomal protein S18]-alanine N-acetyltransferase